MATSALRTTDAYSTGSLLYQEPAALVSSREGGFGPGDR